MPKKTGAGGEPQSYDKATGRYSELSERAKSTEKSIKDFEGLSAEQTKQKILDGDKDIKTKEFTDAPTSAKTAVEKERPEDAWRVDSPSAEEFDENHPNAKKYITSGGSTFAVTSDGDIVGVCKKPGDNKRGGDLLKIAVASGGKKLDSYEGNHEFYTRNGFEPVSWCKWDDRFTPPGWKAERDKKEDIIFYKYTGNSTMESAKDFKLRVPASSDYDTAQKQRDKELR